MPTKTRIILVILFTVIFQFIIGYYFNLHISNPVWWIVTIVYAFFQPFWSNPLADLLALLIANLKFQISLFRETTAHRRKYEFYRDKVKAGSIPIKDFERDAKDVIK